MAVKRAVKGRRTARKPVDWAGSQAGRSSVEQAAEEPELVGNLFDNMKDDAIVVVHRFDPEAGRPVLMYKLEPSEATDVEIQRLSGGGKYTTREHVRNETGQMVFGRQRTIVISGVPRVAKMPRSYEHPEPTPKPEVGTVDNKTSIDDVLTAGILRLFTSQAEASETQAKMYQAMLARPDAPQIDWGDLIKAIAPIVVTLLAKRDDGPNPMEMVTQIAEMVKSSSSPTTQFKDMLETVDSVFSIKEQAAGPPADPLTALAATLPQILEIISSEQKTKGRIPTQEEVQRRLAPSSQPTGTELMLVYAKMLNKFAPMLVRWAREGKDPSLMGEFLFNSIPTQYHGVVREFLLRDDAETVMYQTIPDLREFPQWTKDCFGTLADAFGIGEVEDEVPEDDHGEDAESETIEEVTTKTVEERD